MTDLIERLREVADEAGTHGYGVSGLLREAAAALEAAREDACVALVADIRLSCGDNGKRMQPELVEFIRGLAQDAAKYRWALNNSRWIRGEQEAYVAIPVAPDADLSCVAMRDAAIDQARGKAGQEVGDA